MNRYNLLILLSLFVSTATSADDATIVYRSVGEHGVVSFSDTQASVSDEVMVIATVPAREDELARAALRFEQQLALIEILETSRREREASQLERERQRVELARARADLERSRAPVYVNQGGGYFLPYYASHYRRHKYRGYRDRYYAHPTPTRTLSAPFPAR